MTKKRRLFFRYARRMMCFGLLSFVLFVIFIEEIFEFSPPQIKNAKLQIKNLGKLRQYSHYKILGSCWFKKEQGLAVLFLKGKPFARGWAAGKLVGENAPLLEDALLNRARQYIDQDIVYWALRKIGYIAYRNLPDYFPVKIQKEIYGYAQAVENRHPELGSPYFRAMNYQAAHDLSHQVIDKFLPMQGCTSFAAWGKMTDNNHLIIGRNFDFEIGDVFDRLKLVQVIIPESGIPFVSVSWPGMSGVVSGINKKRIAVVINAAQSDDFRWKGVPVPIIARKILQNAENLEQAYDIVKRSSSCISESFLVADGKSGEAIVIEKTPMQTILRKPQYFAQAIVCVNHFLSEPFEKDQRRKIFMAEGSSPARLRRMRQLLEQYSGKLTPKITAVILRDRQIDNESIPIKGHLHTINPSYCSHSIIIDVTKSILWVSSGPNQAGKYLPLNIEHLWNADPDKNLMENSKIIDDDENMSPQQVKKLNQWRKIIRKWKKEQKLSIEELQTLQEVNPGHFFTMVAWGDYYRQAGKIQKAQIWWKKALENYPYGIWREKISERINNAKEK